MSRLDGKTDNSLDPLTPDGTSQHVGGPLKSRMDGTGTLQSNVGSPIASQDGRPMTVDSESRDWRVIFCRFGNNQYFFFILLLLLLLLMWFKTIWISIDLISFLSSGNSLLSTQTKLELEIDGGQPKWHYVTPHATHLPNTNHTNPIQPPYHLTMHPPIR